MAGAKEEGPPGRYFVHKRSWVRRCGVQGYKHSNFLLYHSPIFYQYLPLAKANQKHEDKGAKMAGFTEISFPVPIQTEKGEEKALGQRNN